MIELIKCLIGLRKAEKELIRAKKKLTGAELDYKELERIVYNIAIGYPQVRISVVLQDGKRIEIEHKGEPDYESFRDRFIAARKDKGV